MSNMYNKLVRDKVPEVIQREGRQCGVTVLPHEKFIQALKEKLIEEAKEIAVSTSAEDLVLEIADLLEVLDTLLAVHDIQRESVLSTQERRRLELGGFKEHRFLLWAD
jgi:predicted house-cleaning noncanonical NTP pyrophosphatase (MazG superfamily)